MELPANTAQFVALVVIALPGVTYATVRNRARGHGASSISLSLKLGEGLAAGVVFDLVYLLVFGQRIVDRFTITHGALPSARAAAFYALTLGVLVPALVAWIAHRGSRWTRPTSGLLHWTAHRLTGVRGSATAWRMRNIGLLTPAFLTTPRAWDFAVPNRGRRFIRIETSTGKFLGGWFAEDSFVSTYPEPQDLYVQQQWRMGPDGAFLSPVWGSEGFWYAMQPGDTIDWIDPERAVAEEQQETRSSDDQEQRH